MQQLVDSRRTAGAGYRTGNNRERIAEIFRRLPSCKIYGILSLAAVLGAFSALSQAVKVSTCPSLMRCGADSGLRPPLPLAGSSLVSVWS